MADLTVINFRPEDSLNDIPATLRRLADKIEADDVEFGHVVNLVYATFSSEGQMCAGYMGPTHNVAAEASLLLQRANLALIGGGGYEEY